MKWEPNLPSGATIRKVCIRLGLWLIIERYFPAVALPEFTLAQRTELFLIKDTLHLDEKSNALVHDMY